jgi:crossover junction endodeoxyribonuclease RuvC
MRLRRGLWKISTCPHPSRAGASHACVARCAQGLDPHPLGGLAADRHQYAPTHRLGSIMKAPTVGEGAVRVLGVDPGLTRCGLGVVDHAPGRPLTMTAAGVVRTPADADIGHRLLLIERGVERWLDEYRPEVVAVERVFSQRNIHTVMGTAQASAVAILCAARRGLSVTWHTPSEVKAAVTGSGSADKAQVGATVTRLLRLDVPPKPADAADALALAICHVWRSTAAQCLQRAVSAHRPAPLTRTPSKGRQR